MCVSPADTLLMGPSLSDALCTRSQLYQKIHSSCLGVWVQPGNHWVSSKVFATEAPECLYFLRTSSTIDLSSLYLSVFMMSFLYSSTSLFSSPSFFLYIFFFFLSLVLSSSGFSVSVPHSHALLMSVSVSLPLSVSVCVCVCVCVNIL